MLQKRIAELEKQGKTGRSIKQAKRLLTTAADRVTQDQTPQKLYWREPKDRSTADAVRIEVLEMLMRLKKTD